MFKNLVTLFNKIKKKKDFGINLFNYLLFRRIYLNGSQIAIPSIYKIDLGDFLKESCLIEKIRKIFTIKQGVFIDVGFNLGQTLIKVKSVDCNKEYYGLDPSTTCYFYTNELIKANRFKNCTLIPIGLSNKTSLSHLFLRNCTDSSASLVTGFRDFNFYSDEQIVAIYEGDLLIEYLGINSISIIKIDTEGSELEVMQGLRHSITKFRPYILCEILPVYDKDSKTGRLRKIRQDKLEMLLKDADYQIGRIHHNGEIVLLDYLEVHSNKSFRDYIFIPLEDRENTMKLLNIKTKAS